MNNELYKMSYSMKKDFDRKVFRIVFFIILFFTSINLILNFVIFPVRQVSVSMSPDIDENSCLFFSPLNTNYYRGSVVLVEERNPEENSFFENVADLFLGFFTARQFYYSERKGLMGERSQIRRVTGLPGDTIYMRDYVLYIKPAGESLFKTEFELTDRSYEIDVQTAPAGWDSVLGVAGTFDEITLGEGEYFLTGDKRNSCPDSRFWGPVKSSSIKAGALVQFFPFNKMKFF